MALGAKRKQGESNTSCRAKAPEPAAPLLVVGIAASAGGLEALCELVLHLPKRSRVTCVVVQHLSPTHRSLLVDLLRRETSLAVQEAKSGLAPQANNIYVTPPGSNITLEHGKLQLTQATERGVPKPSADRFFASLANDQGEHAIGVILSGTGKDGAKGVRAIKAGGGLTFAQMSASAKYAGMPEAAVATGCVDMVLAPQEIAKELGRLANLSRSDDSAPPKPPEAPVYQRILELVRQRTGARFLDYKKTTIQRRLARRMWATHTGSLEEYERVLQTDPSEPDRLHQDILISVTSFFRDPDAFKALDAAIAHIIGSKKPREEIRVWVAGCATGEEAYSMALLIAEQAGERLDPSRLQIFATDIDEKALTQARKGVYHASSLADVDRHLIRKYFTWTGDGYQVNKWLRERIIFARHDLTQEPPFSRMDLISCRNVLIYFEPRMQNRVLDALHYGLRPQGYLFLGKSESAQHRKRFAVVDGRQKIFRREEVHHGSTLPPMESVLTLNISPPPRPAPASTPSLEACIQRIVTRNYVPCGVLVDRNREIRFFLGDVSRYLRLIPGRAHLNAGLLIREELRADFHVLLLKAEKTGQVERGLHISLTKGESTTIRLAVHPIRKNPLHEPLFLVCFEPAQFREQTEATASSAAPSPALAALQRELAASREHLQIAVEQLQTANEELQALTEELQSSNEELQSTNEELETANEELQSTNEELQSRSVELATANANLENVKDNLPYPLIITDQHLRLMILNPAANRVLGISPDDVGQVITTLAVRIDIPDFRAQLLAVIRDGREVELQLSGERDHLMRIRPYRTAQGETKGTVIAFWDNTELRRAQQHLKEKAAQVELQARALEAARHGIVITDATQSELPIVYVNPAFQELTGYAAQEVLGRNCRFLQGPDTDLAARKIIDQSHATGKPARVLLQNYRKDGTPFWNDLSIVPVGDTAGAVSHFIYVEDDVTERHRAEERARLAINVFDSAREGILITDAFGKVLSTNRAFTAMTGYEHDEILGRNPSFMQSGRHEPSFYRGMWEELKAKGEWHGEIWDRRRDGAVVPLLMSISAVRNPEGAVTHFVAFYTDIMRLKEAERRLEMLAYYDPLTGLPNRTLIYERLHQAISRAERENTRIGIMFLDLDRFKVINDTLGHEMGDQLLCQVAGRIKDCLRQVDTVARLGGDEFIVLLEKVEHTQQIHHIVQRVLEALVAPYQLSGRREVYSGASIGIAFFPEDGADVDTLLRNADTAMYRSKSEGRNGYRFYASAMNALHLERLQLENDLRRALKRQEFVVHYQPKVALDTGQTLGLEALIRWNHPERGMLAPREFIGLAEETGLILDVERWVLHQVTEQHRAWRGSPLGMLSISVNLSAPHLEPSAGLIPTLRGLLEASDSPERWLELELLESSMMPCSSEIPKALWSIRELGVRVAIDDFGTGYSNLAYIKHLPIDILKIDQSFVRDIANDPNDAAIVAAVTALTRSLKITAVAEGIETERQVAFLREHGCPEGQGYHFSRPMRAEDLARWQEARSGMSCTSPPQSCC
ncbi:MAG: EAL domain-containing protein [Gammaproteobacteria bacterium]